MQISQQSYQPNPDLPRPEVLGETPLHKQENLPTTGRSSEVQSGLVEQPLSSPPPLTPPPGLDPASYADDDSAASQPMGTGNSQGGTGPHQAEDSDLIEKEWVMRAKAIVEQTKNDPYQQNKQINHFKADYVKKRYDKELKVSEG